MVLVDIIHCYIFVFDKSTPAILHRQGKYNQPPSLKEQFKLILTGTVHPLTIVENYIISLGQVIYPINLQMKI